MAKPARKRRGSVNEDNVPVTKRNRPSSGDGDQTFSEPTTSSLPKSGSDTSYNPIGVTKSTDPPSQAAHNLPGAAATSNQSITSSLAGLISPSTATHPQPSIQPPAPTTSNETYGKGAGIIHPYSVHDPPPGIHPPTSTPKRGRKRRQRATTPPETYTNNLPLVTIVPPIPERPVTGWRRGRAYWLINGVTRITLPILESVDTLLGAEAREQQDNEAWNATLERAVQGVDWRDLLGEPPVHVREILRAKAAEERREREGGNAEVAAREDVPSGGEQSEEVKEGGDVDPDDGEAVGGGVGGRSYVEISCPDGVAGSLIDLGGIAQPEGPGLIAEAAQVEQVGEQSGEPEQRSGEQPEGFGQASGEVGREAGVEARPEPVIQPSLAPIVEPPQDLPGWVNYEARLVNPKYF